MRKALAALFTALILAGCTAPILPPPTSPSLEVLSEDQGWVEVTVTGVPLAGYRILWGDVAAPYGITDVVDGQEVYGHFYQAVEGGRSGEQIPTQYEITLTDEAGQALDQGSVWVPASVCHLELVILDGRTATVAYWGRFGIEYSISWGDRFAEHVRITTQSGERTTTHTYAASGSYSLGMEEIWAPPQTFFTITVE